MPLTKLHIQMKSSYRQIFLALFLTVAPTGFLQTQEVPHPVVNTGVYEFLDELASEQIIEINSAVKPYSRLFIANKLDEANQQRELLNIRQQRELDFYLMDFGKESGRRESGKGGNGRVEKGRVGEGESGRIAITMPADDSSSIGQQSRSAVSSLHQRSAHTPGSSPNQKQNPQKGFVLLSGFVVSLTINPILGGEVFIHSTEGLHITVISVEARVM